MSPPGAHLDRAFARAATKDSRLAGSVRHAPYEEAFSTLWATRLLDRPAFLGSSEAAALTADLDAYLRLLGSLPMRLFDGDVVAYGRALGMPVRRAELLARLAEPGPTPYGRADLYHDGTNFRLLEFNVASDVGGLEYPEFHRALMHTPEFAGFADGHGLEHVDTAAQLVEVWRKECVGRGLDELPTVAIVGANGNTTTLSRLLIATADALERHGPRVVIGEIPGLRYRGSRVSLDGVPVDVVLRFFTIDDLWDDAEALANVEPLLTAHAEDRVVLWTPLDS